MKELYRRGWAGFGKLILMLSVASLVTTPGYGAVGDDPASVIATRTAPGETTAFVCGSGGFLIVQFFLGSALVSEVESGTTCSPVIAAPGSGLPVADAIQYVDENLDDFFPVLFDGDLFGGLGIPSSPVAPITIVSPDTPIESPKLSVIPGFEALR